MLPLSLDVRLKGDYYPRAIVGLIVGMAALHAWATAYDAVAGADKHWYLLSFDLGAPDPVQFVVSIFSHGDWWHWFGNMLYLWVFGAALEDRLCATKFFWLFVFAGVAGGLMEAGLFYWFYWGLPWPHERSLGASGAVFGVMGMTQARFVKARMRVGIGPLWMDVVPFLSWPVPVTWLCGYRLFVEVISLGRPDGIGHLAHIFGFVAGLVGAQFLNFNKESYDELVLNQAEAHAASGWWLAAIERYDRLLALKPRDPRIREARLRCLYKQWPAARQMDPRRRQELLAELQKALSLYFEGGLPAEAVSLWRDFTPPYVMEDLNPKLRLQVEAHRHLVPTQAGHHWGQEEQVEHRENLERELLKAGAAQDGALATELALELYKVKDLRDWPLDAVLVGARGLMGAKHLLGEEFCQRLIRVGSEAQVVEALLILERAWKGTTKQAGFGALFVQGEAQCAALNGNERYRDLKARLKRV